LQRFLYHKDNTKLAISKFLLAFEKALVSDLKCQMDIVHYIFLVFENFSKQMPGQSFLIKKRLPLQLLTYWLSVYCTVLR